MVDLTDRRVFRDEFLLLVANLGHVAAEDHSADARAVVTQAEVYALVYSAYIAAATPAPGPTEEAV